MKNLTNTFIIYYESYMIRGIYLKFPIRPGSAILLGSEKERSNLMKNHILLGSLLTAVLAFILYIGGVHQQRTAQLAIVGQKQRIVQKGHTNPASLPEAHEVKVAAGSTKALAKPLSKKLQTAYVPVQVYSHDLTDQQVHAQVTNTTRKSFPAGNVLRLYVLLAYYQARKDGHIKANSVVQVKAGDLSKGEQPLHAPMSYSYSYLLNLMLQQKNNSAANLIWQHSRSSMPKLVSRLDLEQTKITAYFDDKKVGTTSARDLGRTLLKLYQGKVFDRQTDNQILSSLQSYPERKLTAKVTGTVEQISDDHASVALVRNGSSAYVMALTTGRRYAKMTDIGSLINNWYGQH